VSSIASYVEDQLRDPLHTVDDVTDLDNLDVSLHAVRRLVSTLNCAEYLSVFMVALWNRADHYIFVLFLSSFFFSFISSHNLNGQRLDVYHTSTYGVALVQI